MDVKKKLGKKAWRNIIDPSQYRRFIYYRV